ncbi:MAG: aminodeoxychorismate/anthranilate synthase component II [Candidatus Altiarchaeales archaeon]|nr:aminodeoxychorismate/anthranilate synthase component II [Candidatus Altiarchaeales archaeon]
MQKSRTLVIDNIDSFVYNLVQYVGVCNGNPVVLDNRASKRQVDEEIENGVTHIIISPGPKTPKEAGVSNYIIREYYKSVPILGVCLGHQCIGHVFGGNIRRARTLVHGKTSRITHVDSSIFAGIPKVFEATRYHSLVVDDRNFPEELKITARSLDDNEVMALEHKNFPLFGVQFHPESILTGDGMGLIKNFLKIRKDEENEKINN